METICRLWFYMGLMRQRGREEYMLRSRLRNNSAECHAHTEKKIMTVQCSDIL